jgi:hypothetical protein
MERTLFIGVHSIIALFARADDKQLNTMTPDRMLRNLLLKIFPLFVILYITSLIYFTGYIFLHYTEPLKLAEKYNSSWLINLTAYQW